jgi:hypothetical protein
MPVVDLSDRHHRWTIELADAVMVAEGHAPVVAVLLAMSVGRRVHRCPQRARTPDLQPFPLQRSHSVGLRRGPWRVHDGPLEVARREALGRPRPPVAMVGKAHAPVVAVLGRAVKSRHARRQTQRGRAPSGTCLRRSRARGRAGRAPTRSTARGRRCARPSGAAKRGARGLRRPGAQCDRRGRPDGG